MKYLPRFGKELNCCTPPPPFNQSFLEKRKKGNLAHLKSLDTLDLNQRKTPLGESTRALLAIDPLQPSGQNSLKPPIPSLKAQDRFSSPAKVGAEFSKKSLLQRPRSVIKKKSISELKLELSRISESLPSDSLFENPE